MPLVVGGAAHVGHRIAGFAGRGGPPRRRPLRWRGLPTSAAAELGQCRRVGVDRGQPHPGGGDRVTVERDRRARRRDGPVAHSPFDFRVGTRRVVPHRDPDLDQHLVVRQRGLVRARRGSRRSGSRAHPTARGPGTPLRAPCTPSSGPRPGRPGTATRRWCRGCGPPGRRSPVRRRGRSGTPRPGRRTRAASRWRIIAPMRTSVGSVIDVAQLGARSLMSIRYSGLAMRSFIIGSRLCPPATTRASSPSRSSSPMACSTPVARSYSKGPGTCM